MTAIADQLQVAGFVLLAIVGLAFLVSMMVLAVAVFYEARDRRHGRTRKRARLAGHDRRWQERKAAENGRPHASGVVTNHGHWLDEDAA